MLGRLPVAAYAQMDKHQIQNSRQKACITRFSLAKVKRLASLPTSWRPKKKAGLAADFEMLHLWLEIETHSELGDAVATIVACSCG